MSWLNGDILAEFRIAKIPTGYSLTWPSLELDMFR